MTCPDSGFFQNVELSGMKREQPDVLDELRIRVWHEQKKILMSPEAFDKVSQHREESRRGKLTSFLQF
jgi:hypothetical protein